MTDEEEPLEVVARVVGKARRVPPTRVITSDLHGGRFEPRGTMVTFEAVTVSDVSFAGIHFQRLSIHGSCVFSGCDFSRVRSRYMSYLSRASVQAVYRDCRFDHADLRDFRPEAARFERCSFDHARLDGWRSDLGEFIDCHFAGKVRNVKFWGRAYGIVAEEAGVDRPVNEFRGNDFRQAELISVSFVMGIDLDAQRWPAGPAYIRLDRLGERVRRARAQVIRWTDLEARRDALIMLEVLLSLALSLREYHLGHLDRAERLLEQAERAVDHRQGQRELQVPTHGGMVAEAAAAIALLRAELAGARGDPEGMAGYARSALTQMHAEEHGPRFWARWLAGPWPDWMGGRLADAERASAEILAEGRAAADPQLVMLWCFPLGQVQQARGRLGAALRTYREALRFATQGGRSSPFHECEAHLGIAQVLYERNQLDDALRHVTESVELGRQMMWFSGHELVTSAWVRRAMGEPDSALEAMNEACRMYPGPDTVGLWQPGQSERARLLVAQGRAEEAARWAEERGLAAEDEVSYPREREYLVVACVLLAQSEPDRALGLLERLDALAESQGRTGSVIEIRALRALALQSAGDHQGAVSLLAQTLALAGPEGYVRTFADEGPPMAALLRKLVAEGRRGVLEVPMDYLGRIIGAVEQRGVPAGPDAPALGAGLAAPLTGRELEVLQLLAAGRGNQEIAKELVVTLETVKKHVSHIFDKLGAVNRTQAVVHARQLGLVR